MEERALADQDEEIPQEFNIRDRIPRTSLTTKDENRKSKIKIEEEDISPIRRDFEGEEMMGRMSSMMPHPSYWSMWNMMPMMQMGGYWSPLMGMNPPPNHF